MRLLIVLMSLLLSGCLIDVDTGNNPNSWVQDEKTRQQNQKRLQKALQELDHGALKKGYVAYTYKSSTGQKTQPFHFIDKNGNSPLFSYNRKVRDKNWPVFSTNPRAHEGNIEHLRKLMESDLKIVDNVVYKKPFASMKGIEFSLAQSKASYCQCLVMWEQKWSFYNGQEFSFKRSPKGITYFFKGFSDDINGEIYFQR